MASRSFSLFASRETSRSSRDTPRRTSTAPLPAHRLPHVQPHEVGRVLPLPSIAAAAPPARSTAVHVALCVIGAVRTLLLPPVLESLRVQIAAAAQAARVDTFVALSESDRLSALMAQQLLHPVWMIAEMQHELQNVGAGTPHNICAKAPRLLRQACLDVHQPSSGPVAHGRLQFWWIARCLAAVQQYEQLGAISYDFVVRVRPDIVYFNPLPPLHSLSAYHVHTTFKTNGELFDVLFVVPQRLREAFMKAVLRTVSDPSVKCCPEFPFQRTLRALNITTRALTMRIAIRRPCSLECLFPTLDGDDDANWRNGSDVAMHDEFLRSKASCRLPCTRAQTGHLLCEGL